MAEAGPRTSGSAQVEESSDGNSPSADQTVGLSTMERIQQRKQQVYNWPRNVKLLKLAGYSGCQKKGCICVGWKASTPLPNNSNIDETKSLGGLGDPCLICTHSLASHTTHLKSLQDKEVNRLLGMVVDEENIDLSIYQAVDPLSQKAYYFLVKLIRKHIHDMTKPSIVDGPLGQPPFERPSIAEAITNFVFHKFCHSATGEWQIMYDLAKVLIHSLNHWNCEAPNNRRINASDPYYLNYSRWLIFCYVPVFCDSLPRYETTLVFGRTMLRAIFRSVPTQLMDKCRNECMPPDKRELYLTHFPKFLQVLEEEIYAPTSPIWDTDFKMPPPQHLQDVPDSKEDMNAAHSNLAG